MQDASATRARRPVVVIAAGILVLMTAAAGAAEPIIGPPIPVGERGVAVADPLIPVPAEAPCVVTLYTADSPTGTFDDYAPHPFTYTPPAGCDGPWNKVVFKADFNVTAGVQFDRTASVWIGGANIYFGTTQEPGQSVSPSWHVERDVTDLSSLLEASHPANAVLYNVYDSTYNGSITGSAELDFYPATPEFRAPRVPDQVLSLSADPAGNTISVYTDQTPASRTFTLPTNIARAYIVVTAQPQSGDEFWYTCFPEPYADEFGNCGGTGFREAEVAIDGKPAGIVPISGWVYTGGVDPYLWKPTPGVQTLNFKRYRIDITPFAGMLDDGQPHTVSVGVVTGDPDFQNNSQYFDTAATLLLYQDSAVSQLTGALVQDADSGVHPVQHNVASAGGALATFRVTSRHRLVTRGYLDTPRGRAFSNVVQDVRFRNSQQVVSTNTRFKQAIEQTSTASQHSFGHPLSGPDHRTVEWSFPLTMDIDVQLAPDGSETQATTVHQAFNLQFSQGGPWGTYAYTRDQHGDAADTLNFDPSGNFTGPTGQTASQDYDFTDSDGGCYSRSIAAAAGAVTTVTDGVNCGMGH